MSTRNHRPHGGGYIRGQGRQAQVNPSSPPHGQDLNELQAVPIQQEMPAGGSYEVAEMPSDYVTRPVELRIMQQNVVQQPQQRPQPQPYQQPLPPHQNPFVQHEINQEAYPVPKVYANSNPYPELKGYPESKISYMQKNDSLSKVDSQWGDSFVSAKAQREIAITIDRPPSYSHFLSTAPNTRVRKPQKGRWNAFSPGSSWRWMKKPHVFKHPSVKSASRQRYRHRDSMARVYRRPAAERSLDVVDGRLTKLMVQTVDEIYNGHPTQHTWRRTYIRKVGPIMLRAAYWPFKRAPSDSDEMTADDKLAIAIRWLPACLALFFVLPWPKPRGIITEGLKYHPFPYKYWGTCKVARNSKEDTKMSRALHWSVSSDNPSGERILRPRYLMFLNSPGKEGMHGSSCMKDEEWNAVQVDESKKNLPYLFIAYTIAQFDDVDLDALHDIAEVATRKAGLSAYWVGCSCMPEDDNIEEDVYRINDVIRGAHSLVIAVGNKKGDPRPKDTSALLHEWGSRMWTFPEALLSPNEKYVEVYTRGNDLNRPLIIAKKDLPGWAWDDADTSRQIMDHFTGSLMLSRIELVNLGIKCLQARQTTTYLQGDMVYALMGLLRRRPMVDRTDSEFQAFARLSLANDSDCLLERLICVAPKKYDEKWLSAKDAWDVNLWDIYPSCQVAGVGETDTVILDGCRSATIHWDGFQPVAVARNDSWKRFFARLIVRCSSILIVISAALISYDKGISAPLYKRSTDPFSTDPYSTSSDDSFSNSDSFGSSGPSPTTVFAAFLLIIGLGTWLASPYLVKIMYGGKFWDQQAWLFGFEGHLDIGTIESLIFGYDMSRLSWSPSSSPLSRHSTNEYNEWVGRDPTDDPEIEKLVQKARSAKMGEMRVFTIVDTYTMTVTLIEAVRPPVMVLLCASEGPGIDEGLV
ncbi:hypothetical protein EG329_000193 [Mollisiaceae sp. DMI_Dod_QoI]|nr:hypothetical protein EG329_000193 [Helotiales sp. DMI_Dod_QoI]